ncbi:SDR family oxidoreductase [Cohnella lubricantis]|uniref:SDR family oxidoreductase n=1 Tax=Cohnella lubricantis TaxID=2163172 RepID=A0A841TAQ2_9BACL|nr:SDR family oxidoreductase [Cohnella lubricantis]MBB6677156.1 SDR family oxidoreductase [Cohnella lubricantis]MBP2117033.1 NAD(P)-dependent dehydrogenase (short-subunit alcohol dehydrogenase family) [Cohnella lubricantis]
MNFEGKRVLITGGGSGIGAAAAEAYRRAGAEVAVFDISFKEERLADKRIEIPVDLTESEQVQAAFSRLWELWDTLDVLVNNAGVEYVASLEDSTEAGWDRVMDVNVKSVFLCCQAALPRLKASRGNIVNTASQLAFVGSSLFTAYTASKAAVVNFTRSLALETAKDCVRVNCVCPGAIDTPLLRRQFEGGRGPQGTLGDLIGMHPMGRLGHPEEIAECILFLSSPAASFVTGSAMMADGGYTVH